MFYPTKITRYTVIAVYYNLGVQFVSEYIINCTKSFYDKASSTAMMDSSKRPPETEESSSVPTFAEYPLICSTFSDLKPQMPLFWLQPKEKG